MHAALECLAARFQDMPQIVRDPTTGLDRLVLSRLPTPLDPAPTLAAALGLARLSVKREDLSGYALGGNKLRQLDFILAEAFAAGADILVTTAGSQSNFCRSLAGAAAKLGLELSPAPARRDRHRLGRQPSARRDTGSRRHVYAGCRSMGSADRAGARGIAANYEQQGRKPLHRAAHGRQCCHRRCRLDVGRSGTPARCRSRSGIPDVVISVCGSGLSLAGLALGCKSLSCPARIVGVSAQQPAARLKSWIVTAANEAATRLGLSSRLTEDDLTSWIARSAPATASRRRRALRRSGSLVAQRASLLDPVYTGKGLAGLQAALRTGLVRQEHSVIFVHSGGTPGLFAHAEAFGTDGLHEHATGARRGSTSLLTVLGGLSERCAFRGPMTAPPMGRSSFRSS